MANPKGALVRADGSQAQVVPGPHAVPSPVFPLRDRPRLWGVAVSHYQVEGGDPCDWTDWEAAGRTKGEPCAEAVGSWDLYEHDAELARGVGANAFRFSVSWSRVEPEPGVFDEEALARYRRFVDHLVASGLEPVVTLFHYTHPRWFAERSPWTHGASADAFARFAEKVAASLGPHARVWTVLNEPLVFLLGGFIDGQIPPGLKDAGAAKKALANLFRAHAYAAQAIRKETPRAAIGVAHNMAAFVPERKGKLFDGLLARLAHRLYNRGILEAFVSGSWDLFLPPLSRFKGRCPELVGSLDFVGVNFYSRLHMRFPGTKRFTGDFEYRDRSGRGLTDNGWEIVPEELTGMLVEAARTGLPLMITENGLADADDSHRAAFMADHVAAVEEAERRGVPVAGYLHWSLVDNYEWLDGYGPKFGLFEVDRKTRQRRPRASAALFRQLGERFLARPLHL